MFHKVFIYTIIEIIASCELGAHGHAHEGTEATYQMPLLPDHLRQCMVPDLASSGLSCIRTVD